MSFTVSNTIRNVDDTHAPFRRYAGQAEAAGVRRMEAEYALLMLSQWPVGSARAAVTDLPARAMVVIRATSPDATVTARSTPAACSCSSKALTAICC